MNAIVRFFSAASSHLSARLEWASGKVYHLHSAIKPEQETQANPPELGTPTGYILTGFGLGYHLQSFLKQLPVNEATTPLIIIEYYPELLAQAQKLHNLPPCKIITKDSNPKELRQVRQWMALKSIVWQEICHPPSKWIQRDFYRSVWDALVPTYPTNQRHLAKQTTQAGHALFTRNSFLEKELCSALQQLQNVAPTPINCAELTANPYSFLQFKHIKSPFHTLWSINGAGLDAEGEVAYWCNKNGVRLVVWFVDDPRPILSSLPGNYTACTALCWERSYLPWLKQQGFASVIHAPLAGDAQIMQKHTHTTKTYPVSWIASPMGGRFLQSLRQRSVQTPAINTKIEDLLKTWQPHNRSQWIADVEEAFAIDFDCANSTTTKSLHWARSFALHSGSFYGRRQVAKELLPNSIHIFGDVADWQATTQKQTLHPPVDYYQKLPFILNQSLMTLNATSYQMPTAVNQRVFDAPLCGCLVLTDAQTDLDELFPQKLVQEVLWHSNAELKDKIQWFLKRPDLVASLAEKWRAHCLQENLYVHRIAKLLQHPDF
jgi:hypothetical protein